MTVNNKEEQRLESAALLLLSLGNTEDVNERKPLRYCRWTAAEDRLLAQLVKKKYGTWKKIAARIPGRTVRQTRSRWLKLCKKYQLALRGKQQQQQLDGTTTTFSSPPEFMQDSDQEQDKDHHHHQQQQQQQQEKLLPPLLRHDKQEQPTLPSLFPYLETAGDRRLLLPKQPQDDMLQILYASKDPVNIPVANRIVTAYQCLYPACNRIFQTPTLLNDHVVTHGKSSTLPFECKQCGQTFNSKEPLEMHMIDHDMERHKQNTTIIVPQNKQ